MALLLPLPDRAHHVRQSVPGLAQRPRCGSVRFGTMRMIADAMVVTPTISALYKPYLGGYIYVSDLPDRVVITFYARESV